MKPKVLILDDEPEIGNLLALYLRDEFDTAIFTDPQMACQEIEQQGFDLVISDIRMPMFDGLEVVRHTKKTSPQTEIVLMTGHLRSEEEKKHAFDLGVASILSKPFGDPSGLVSHLNHLILSRARHVL